MYYIMRATRVLYGKNRVSLGEVQQQLGSDKTTILVVRRSGHDTAGKFRKTFISGYGHGYEAIAGTQKQYTEDTGNGYANKNQTFVVENVIEYTDGEITNRLNDIGINETRSVWVMK